jgi:glycine dehydrogenase subunit 1
MLEAIGAADIEELYESIPENLRFRGEMDLPEPLSCEMQLTRHMESLLAQNQSCKDLLNFRGGGCAQHYVPAICDEVNSRSEFLTAYAGEPYEDHGRFQTLFEYASLMGELLDMDVVSVPTFDWNQAAATAIRMGQRITQRDRVLIYEHISPDRRSTIENYCRSAMQIEMLRCNPDTGMIDLNDLQAKLGPDVIGVYFESPGYLGRIEVAGREISDAVHEIGGLSIVGTDPIALGVVAPPAQFGADIVCGDLQPLGIHMNQGGGQAGFIATCDEEQFVREYPSRLFGICRTDVPGEWGFGDVLYDDRTSFGAREHGKEFVGTATALWGITAGVYLALMGPGGMQQIGQTIMQNAQYAMKRLAEIDGLTIRAADSPHFKEFVVDLSGLGVTVGDLNRSLLDSGIMSGIDLTGTLPGHDNCLLLCVTEIHTADDINRMVAAVAQIVAGCESPR